MLLPLATVVVGAFAIASPTQAEGGVGEGLSSHCQNALRTAYEHIKTNAGEMGFQDAADYLQATAGSACGFDVTGAVENTVDVDALEAFVDSLAETGDEIAKGTQGGVEDPDSLVAAAGASPCFLAGGGSGLIKGYVLNILVGEWNAVGEWKPIVDSGREIVQVFGHSGLVGAEQNGPARTILVGPVGIPSLGGTESYCVWLETGQEISGRCWNFIIYQKCTQTVEVRGKFISCSAQASQYVVVRNLLRIDHAYQAALSPDDECGVDGPS